MILIFRKIKPLIVSNPIIKNNKEISIFDNCANLKIVLFNKLFRWDDGLSLMPWKENERFVKKAMNTKITP